MPCEKCIHYKMHHVQRQLYRTWCDINEKAIEYLDGCNKFEP